MPSRMLRLHPWMVPRIMLSTLQILKRLEPRKGLSLPGSCTALGCTILLWSLPMVGPLGWRFFRPLVFKISKSGVKTLTSWRLSMLTCGKILYYMSWMILHIYQDSGDRCSSFPVLDPSSKGSKRNSGIYVSGLQFWQMVLVEAIGLRFQSWKLSPGRGYIMLKWKVSPMAAFGPAVMRKTILYLHLILTFVPSRIFLARFEWACPCALLLWT